MLLFADGKRLSPNDTEIVGCPSWTNSDTYSLAAKAEGAAALPPMAGPMLQALLEDRFKPKIRRATKEARVYLCAHAGETRAETRTYERGKLRVPGLAAATSSSRATKEEAN